MSTKTFLEVEAKFAVAESIQLLRATRLSGVNHIAETRKHALSAIYYDTEDLRLTHAKITSVAALVETMMAGTSRFRRPRAAPKPCGAR